MHQKWDLTQALKLPRTISLSSLGVLQTASFMGHSWGIHTDYHQVMVGFERSSHLHYSVIDISRKKSEVFYQSVFDSKTNYWITMLAFLFARPQEIVPTAKFCYLSMYLESSLATRAVLLSGLLEDSWSKIVLTFHTPMNKSTVWVEGCFTWPLTGNVL